MNRRKVHVKDLAIFGGSPAFAETLHVGRPNIGSREVFQARMDDIFNRGWLTNNGAYLREFEQKVAQHLGVRHCIAMCNGTVALEIAVRALGMTGEVIVPSFTFVATAHCLQWQEITPVFCDVDPVCHSIDPAKIERLITPKTTGILAVHLWGIPCNVEALQEVANRNQLKLIFDASHAMSVSYNGKMIGNFGDAEVFSFHATKFVNCFEGGAICTNNDETAEKVRLMKNFGFSGLDNVIYLGTNGKMNEACAAMGLTSLESIEKFLSHNQANYLQYRESLAGLSGCRMLEYEESRRNNYQYVVLEIDEKRFGMSRDQLMELLHAENVRARRYFYPGVHRMEPYRSYYPNAGLLLPVTNALATKILCLPTGTPVSRAQVFSIAALINFIHCNASDIRSRREAIVRRRG